MITPACAVDSDRSAVKAANKQSLFMNLFSGKSEQRALKKFGELYQPEIVMEG